MRLGTHWPGTKTILCSVVDNLDNHIQVRYTLARQQYENHNSNWQTYNKLSEKAFFMGFDIYLGKFSYVCCKLYSSTRQSAALPVQRTSLGNPDSVIIINETSQLTAED